MKRMIPLIFVIVLILPSLSLTAMAQEENEDDNNDEVSSTLLSRIQEFIQWYRQGVRKNPFLFTRISPTLLLQNAFMGRYFIYQLLPPIPIQASPSSITINYKEEAYFSIEGIDPDTGEVATMMSLSAGAYDWGYMQTKFAFHFEVEPFENMDVWNIQFDPPVVEAFTSKKHLDWVGADLPFKTNVSIRLNPNVTDPSLYTQDIRLRINVIREYALDTYALLSGPPDYVKKSSPDFDEYIRRSEELGIRPRFKTGNPREIVRQYLLMDIAVWNMNRVLPSYMKEVESTVEILIKVNRYHEIDLKAPETIEITPYEIKTIPISIQNIGSHIDTYNFRATSDNDNIIVVPPPSITLRPGEKGEALVGVAAPMTLYALGDISNIRVEAFSIYDAENVFSNTITLKSKGLYMTGIPTFYFSVVVITLIIALAILRHIIIVLRNKKKIQKIKTEISEEKKIIKPAKKKNEKTLKKELHQKKKVSKGFFSNVFNDSKKEKKIKKPKPKQIKPSPKPKISDDKKQSKALDLQQIRRQKLLDKIRKEEMKQK